MQKQNTYIFPAVFDYADDGISIEFPDLPGCLPCAFSTDEALHNAREALGLHLLSMEEDGDAIPEPSDILNIKHEPNQAVVLIDVFMPSVRSSVNNKSVNKTVTIPQWLLTAGRDANINFSQTLQDALIQKLGIKREIKHKRSKTAKA